VPTAVLHLDHAAALESADPLRPDGKVEVAPAKVRACNDAQVRLPLA
jgi:hypothetical protein